MNIFENNAEFKTAIIKRNEREQERKHLEQEKERQRQEALKAEEKAKKELEMTVSTAIDDFVVAMKKYRKPEKQAVFIETFKEWKTSSDDGYYLSNYLFTGEPSNSKLFFVCPSGKYYSYRQKYDLNPEGYYEIYKKTLVNSIVDGMMGVYNKENNEYLDYDSKKFIHYSGYLMRMKDALKNKNYRDAVVLYFLEISK